MLLPRPLLLRRCLATTPIRYMSSSAAVVSVTVSWLSENASDPNVIPIDATWLYPNSRPTARERYLLEHITSRARYFDIDDIRDHESKVPRMFPSKTYFEQRIGHDLGISNENHLVIYDDSPILSSHRTYWMFKFFGHERVSLLEGGIAGWKAAGFPVESGEPTFTPTTYIAKEASEHIADYEEVLNLIKSKENQRGSDSTTVIVDARAAAISQAVHDKPKTPGLPHMPGAIMLPFTLLLDADGHMKSESELRTIFAEAKLPLDKPIIASCGSGVTACVMMTALQKVGAKQVRLYDGSWSEYSTRPDSIIVEK